MKASFAMAIHFHQPVGNFDHVIENACNKCYLPFLSVLEKYPSIKINIHFTGCLLEWIEDKNPILFKKIRKLANSGQVELLGGGFYEPILPSIPKRDRLSQIKMLSEYIDHNFQQRPKGAWVAERVWEPSLPSDMNDADIKYVILDDTHFMYSGIEREKMNNYYVTEDNGKTIFVFPSDKELRYCIPYKLPVESIAYMKKVLAYNSNPVFIYGDDGEKFGEWPGTYKWVYEEKWLENFFQELVDNSDWLETMKISDIVSRQRPLDRVYLSTASYDEMLQWALPAGSQESMENVIKDIQYSGKENFYRPFIKGGFWRNFLSKYPESNNMNKKMIYVSNRLDEIKQTNEYDEKEIKDIEKYILRGQCNCAYWHGVFGGLYLYHLRNTIYHNLIKSEKMMDTLVYGQKNFCKIKEIDIDADGYQEVIMENRSLYLCFDPEEGGALKEFDSKKNCHNFINSLARRKESYHRKILEKLQQKCNDNNQDEFKIDKEIEGNIYYDWYNRYSFLDHFISTDVDIDSFSRCQYHETGDFVKEAYYHKITVKEDAVSLFMKKDGWVSGAPVCIEKNITLTKDGSYFIVNYEINNTGRNKLKTILGIELNLTLPFADWEEYFISSDDSKEKISLKKKTVLNNLKKIKVNDSQELLYQIECNENIKELWTFPVKTVSQSEKAYDFNYQSTVFLPVFEIEIEEGKGKNIGLKISTSI